MDRDTCNIELALKEIKEDLFHVGVCAEEAKLHYIAELMYQARKQILEAERHLNENTRETQKGS